MGFKTIPYLKEGLLSYVFLWRFFDSENQNKTIKTLEKSAVKIGVKRQNIYSIFLEMLP